MEVPYNPLDKEHLAGSIGDALLAKPCGPLPPESTFLGAGIYAIYYSGPFPAYAPFSSEECDSPIYVGKAIPAGGSTGFDLVAEVGPVLYGRLREHADSVTAAENLELSDFKCRYLVTDSIWIPLGESLLISSFRPAWNKPLTGFGNHDPGGKRRTGTRSRWDTVHPGRWWAWVEEATPRPETADQLLELLDPQRELGADASVADEDSDVET